MALEVDITTSSASNSSSGDRSTSYAPSGICHPSSRYVLNRRLHDMRLTIVSCIQAICRDLWALHLSLLPTPPSPEPYIHAQELRGEATGSAGEVSAILSQSHRPEASKPDLDLNTSTSTTKQPDGVDADANPRREQSDSEDSSSSDDDDDSGNEIAGPRPKMTPSSLPCSARTQLQARLLRTRTMVKLAQGTTPTCNLASTVAQVQEGSTRLLQALWPSWRLLAGFFVYRRCIWILYGEYTSREICILHTRCCIVVRPSLVNLC